MRVTGSACVDCSAPKPGRRPRPAPFEGPRCATHHQEYETSAGRPAFSCTCRYCGELVLQSTKRSPRVHSECRLAASMCKHCGKFVEPPARMHPECRNEASRAARELAADAARRCPRCKKVKAPSKFSNDASRADGKYPYCVDCQGANNGLRLQDSEAPLTGKLCPLCDTPIRGRANRMYCSSRCRDRVRALRSNFGMTPEQYRELVAAADGRCPICKNRCKSWQVDHDHATGKVTGVVCARCNVGLLAYSNHSLERAQALVAYLFETPAEKLGIDVTAPETAPKSASQLHNMWRRGASKVS